MATTSDIRNGLCIRYNHDIFKVTEFLHVKPGKGPAFVRTKLKSVTTGKVIDNTFSSGHKIEEVRVETHKYQFLYKEGEFYYFMHVEDFTQIRLLQAALDMPNLLKEGEVVTILINTEDNLPLSVDMPPHVILEVTQTEPGLKGNTATNATKSATLETGAEVNVPLFINEGDKVKVETEKGTYKERIKE
jgi:elongation factor P